ncbi:uncharacterized protein LOC108602555 [Drosophila busckii]|uniref:uncharacterized protein LOC108602555 n=1 Tax=Drosophila busckii TaxID=30019 RepID=UPI00083F1C1B|nr:uncharacterized protein LOC108602555 [Drosophila busckii]
MSPRIVSWTCCTSGSGSIREYSQVGDGIYLNYGRHHSLSLLPMPMADLIRSRSHNLVRKVTIMGSHVLRYVSRSNNLSQSRYIARDYQRELITRLDQMSNDGVNTHLDASISELQNFRLSRVEQELCLPYKSRYSEEYRQKFLFNSRMLLYSMCLVPLQALIKLLIRELYFMV